MSADIPLCVRTYPDITGNCRSQLVGEAVCQVIRLANKVDRHPVAPANGLKITQYL
jgi:hypothetical protein